jgi:hypothetical protein
MDAKDSSFPIPIRFSDPSLVCFGFMWLIKQTAEHHHGRNIKGRIFAAGENEAKEAGVPSAQNKRSEPYLSVYAVFPSALDRQEFCAEAQKAAIQWRATHEVTNPLPRENVKMSVVVPFRRESQRQLPQAGGETISVYPQVPAEDRPLTKSSKVIALG